MERRIKTESELNAEKAALYHKKMEVNIMADAKRWEEIRDQARALMQPRCMVCPICNGKACASKLPGMGGKGEGLTYQRNYSYLKDHIKINMDVLQGQFSSSTKAEFLGRELSLPVFPAPIGMVAFSLSEALNEYTYAKAVVEGTLAAGTLAFTGGGALDESFFEPLKVIKEHDGLAIPTIKPYKEDVLYERISLAEETGAIAFAIDIDTAGLVHAANTKNIISRKGPEELRAICERAKKPFIVKGIMTEEAARKAADTGIYGLVVSNHGGRVMDGGLSTAEVLPAIRKAVGDKVKVFVDGGVRTGGDVFKMLALGADYVLIGRPYAIAAYGGGAEGVALYTEKLRDELVGIMEMTGCATLKDISAEKIAIL